LPQSKLHQSLFLLNCHPNSKKLIICLDKNYSIRFANKPHSSCGLLFSRSATSVISNSSLKYAVPENPQNFARLMKKFFGPIYFKNVFKGGAKEE
jgi:hypothetical protein